MSPTPTRRTARFSSRPGRPPRVVTRQAVTRLTDSGSDRDVGRDPGRDEVPFRVEFHTAERVTVLCQGVRCFPHHTALTPFATHLRLAGTMVGGWLLLVRPGGERGETGDTVVARRRVPSTSEW